MSQDTPPSAEPPALPPYAERVLDVAELIPPGRVMTYGDIAEWLEEGGPRQVGRVMALYGSAVPWWRVVRSDGALLPGHERRALAHYRTEGTPLREATLPLLRHVTELVARCRGEAAGPPAAVTATALWAGLHGIAQLWSWGSLPLALGDEATGSPEPLVDAVLDAHLGPAAP